MKKISANLPSLMGLALCSGLLAGCVLPQSGTTISPVPPPQTLHEVKPDATDMVPYVIWRPGYWRWNGVNYEWARGYYMQKPNFSAAWMNDRWEGHNYGWVFVPGYWK